MLCDPGILMQIFAGHFEHVLAPFVYSRQNTAFLFARSNTCIFALLLFSIFFSFLESFFFEYALSSNFLFELFHFSPESRITVNKWFPRTPRNVLYNFNRTSETLANLCTVVERFAKSKNWISILSVPIKLGRDKNSAKHCCFRRTTTLFSSSCAIKKTPFRIKNADVVSLAIPIFTPCLVQYAACIFQSLTWLFSIFRHRVACVDRLCDE